jgi:hypothetical protein
MKTKTKENSLEKYILYPLWLIIVPLILLSPTIMSIIMLCFRLFGIFNFTWLNIILTFMLQIVFLGVFGFNQRLN